MKPQFITAIYTGLEGTRLNGNTAAIYDRYKHSLHSLAHGGYSIICYTSHRHIEELREFFEDTPNVNLIIEELESNYFHNEIEYIKDIHPKYITEDAWRSRCVEIMWGKFYWLWKHVSELEASDSLFWIDAGIFHGGLISNQYRSKNSKNFFDFDKITKERNLYNDLVNFSNNKIINIRSEMVNHGSDDFYTIFNERPQYGVVAGIFGGKRDVLLEYIAEMVNIMQLVIDHNLLIKEEEIMYLLNHRNPQKFADFFFRTWYNSDWNMIYEDGIRTSFSDFFEVIRE